MEKKKVQIWLPMAFGLIMIAGMFLGYQLRSNLPWPGRAMSMGSRATVDQVMDLIRNRYVDEVSTDTLNDVAIDAMLEQLDPHSVYIPPRQLQGLNEDLAGRFEGIGVEFNIFDDTVHIVNVLKDGPSDKAGLMMGDRIVAVGDSVVAGNHITGDRIRSMLRGPGATQVQVTVVRNGARKNFTITRGYIPLHALDAAYMPLPGTGYIRLNKFAETTYREFMESLEALQKQGMKSLILDLRDNGGGILEEAVEMADEFLDNDKLIVYTEGKHAPRREYKCRRHGLFEAGKLVVLIDEGSASATEVLTGALQDWGRATVIGRRSFGKGLVQEQYDLTDGAGLRLTVARYFTPLGRSIQKPYQKGFADYDDEIMARYHKGEMTHADSVPSNNGKKYKTADGKTVYGGGGITPDVFVPLDTSGFDSTLAQLYRRNTIGNFIYRYYSSNRDAFASYKDARAFAAAYQPGDDIIHQLVAFAKKDSIDMTMPVGKSRENLGLRLKCLMARQIWRTEGYFEVVNEGDPVMKKALETLSK